MPGDIGLSEKMRADLTECFVEKTRLPRELAFSFRRRSDTALLTEWRLHEYALKWEGRE